MNWLWWIVRVWVVALVVGGLAWIVYTACVAWYEGSSRRRGR